jgi:hypothetical protein
MNKFLLFLIILLSISPILAKEKLNAKDSIDETVLYCPDLYGVVNDFNIGTFLIINNTKTEQVAVFDDDSETKAVVLIEYDVKDITAKEVILVVNKNSSSYVEGFPEVWSYINRETLEFNWQSWNDLTNKTNSKISKCEISSIDNALEMIRDLSLRRDKERDKLREKNKF